MIDTQHRPRSNNEEKIEAGRHYNLTGRLGIPRRRPASAIEEKYQVLIRDVETLVTTVPIFKLDSLLISLGIENHTGSRCYIKSKTALITKQNKKLIFTNVLECYGIHSRVNLVRKSNRCDLIGAMKCVNGAVEGVRVRRLATTLPSSDRCSTTSNGYEFIFSDKMNLCRRWRGRTLNVYASVVS